MSNCGDKLASGMTVSDNYFLIIIFSFEKAFDEYQRIAISKNKVSFKYV